MGDSIIIRELEMAIELAKIALAYLAGEGQKREDTIRAAHDCLRDVLTRAVVSK